MEISFTKTKVQMCMYVYCDDQQWVVWQQMLVKMGTRKTIVPRGDQQPRLFSCFDADESAGVVVEGLGVASETPSESGMPSESGIKLLFTGGEELSGPAKR